MPHHCLRFRNLRTQWMMDGNSLSLQMAEGRVLQGPTNYRLEPLISKRPQASAVAFPDFSSSLGRRPPPYSTKHYAGDCGPTDDCMPPLTSMIGCVRGTHLTDSRNKHHNCRTIHNPRSIIGRSLRLVCLVNPEYSRSSLPPFPP